MRPYILAETNWLAIKDTHFDLAVLPWGATEAHNYHLPYSTDVIEADALAAAAAEHAWNKGAKLIVLPTIPFGVNTGQADILLDMNLNPSTQFAILCDVAQTLNRQGIHKLLVLNAHGGNDFKTMLRELGLKYPDMFFCTAFCFGSVDKQLFFEAAGDHADEMETSLLLHLRPELVLPKEHWGDGKAKANKVKAFSEGWLWTERKWSQVTDDTGIGSPHLASKEKGELFFNALAKKMGEAFFEIASADVKNIYE